MCMAKRNEEQIQVHSHVDDLLITFQRPQQNFKDLKEQFMLKIKGDGPLEYHLG